MSAHRPLPTSPRGPLVPQNTKQILCRRRKNGSDLGLRPSSLFRHHSVAIAAESIPHGDIQALAWSMEHFADLPVQYPHDNHAHSNQRRFSGRYEGVKKAHYCLLSGDPSSLSSICLPYLRAPAPLAPTRSREHCARSPGGSRVLGGCCESPAGVCVRRRSSRVPSARTLSI